ncbi:outer membrane protein assembly factor BamB family protein [Streptomyces sp. NPDC054770]
MTQVSAFRHDPVKSVLPGGEHGTFHWSREPVVFGHRRLTHHNERLGRTLPVPVSASPAVVPGVGVLLAADDGRVRFYGRGLRKVFWERRLDSGVYASLVVDPVRRRVVVAATSGLITCLDLRGKLVWAARAGLPVYATPVALPAADLLVVAAFHARCLAFRLSTGEPVFDRDLPEPWHAAPGGTASYRDPYASPAGTDEGSVVVCCGDHVIALSGEGRELWRFAAGADIKASPVFVRATAEVVICTVGGDCLFLDARTGRLRHTECLDAKITASPALSADVLAVGAQDGTVTGVDVRTHLPVWRAGQGAPCSYTSFSVLPNGDFIATAERGNVIALRRCDGRFRWESSQVLGLPDHEPRMDTTPLASPDGALYCAAYSGDVYEFRFQPATANPEAASCPP